MIWARITHTIRQGRGKREGWWRWSDWERERERERNRVIQTALSTSINLSNYNVQQVHLLICQITRHPWLVSVQTHMHCMCVHAVVKQRSALADEVSVVNRKEKKIQTNLTRKVKGGGIADIKRRRGEDIWAVGSNKHPPKWYQVTTIYTISSY